MVASLRDVARRAGVSPATASRVMNGHPQVSEDARIRVLQAAKDLDYTIESAARPRGAWVKHRVLSVIVPDVSTPFYCAILQGVEKEAFARQFDLVLYTTEGRSQENIVGRVAGGKTTSGLVLVTPRHGEDKAFCAIDMGIPIVVVDHRAEGSGFPHVTVDNLRAAYEATTYLVKRGHRRIGLITGPLEIESARDRLRGYRLALEEAGLAYNEGLVLQGDFEQPTAYRLIKEYARHHEMPDAWFCSNDLMAAGAIEALK